MILKAKMRTKTVQTLITCGENVKLEESWP